MAEPEVVTSDPVPSHADWPKVLEWIEKQGQESLKARFATADNISKEAQTTLTVLLAGVGGSATYAVRIAEPGGAGPVVVAFAAACVYLIALSILLVWECMMFESYPALSQDPANLMQPEFGLDALREVELENLSKRILDATAINNRRAKRLNALRIAAALTPVGFAIAAAVAPAATPLASAPVTVSCEVTSAKPASSSSFTCRLGK